MPLVKIDVMVGVMIDVMVAYLLRCNILCDHFGDGWCDRRSDGGI